MVHFSTAFEKIFGGTEFENCILFAFLYFDIFSWWVSVEKLRENKHATFSNFQVLLLLYRAIVQVMPLNKHRAC